MTQQEQKQPSVLIIGLGALGVLYGALLARGGVRVVAYARSTAAQLEGEGIELRSAKYGTFTWRPARVVRNDAEAREEAYDYILTTFKLVPELRTITSLIAPVICPGSAPALVLVQNGINVEREPYASLCEPGAGGEAPLCSALISCCAWLGATLVDGGKAVDHGGLERLMIGLYPSAAPDEDSPRTRAWKRFVELYAAGGGGAESVDNVQVVRWQKVLWNACWGGLCLLSRQPVSALLQADTIRYSAPVVRGLMEECMSVARAEGLGADVLPETSVDEAFGLTFEERPMNAARKGNLKDTFKPSILMDLEAQRPMELSGIVGNVVSLARKHNLSTPRLDLLLAAIRPAQVAAVRAARDAKDEEEVPTSGGFPEGADAVAL